MWTTVTHTAQNPDIPTAKNLHKVANSIIYGRLKLNMHKVVAAY